MGKSTITYNGSVIAETEENGNIDVIYDGNTIATVAEGETKTLKCAGKVMRSNLYIGARTLLCEMSKMLSDIIVDVVGGFPAEPTAYTLIATYIASQTWTAPENGYFQVEVFGASGNGGACAIKASSTTRVATGGGGGGGGFSASKIKLNKGDIVTLNVGAVGATTSATINSSIESYSSPQVASGANGTDGTVSSSGTRTAGKGGPGGVASGGNHSNANGTAGGNGETGSFAGVGGGTRNGGAGGTGANGAPNGGGGGGCQGTTATTAGSGSAGFIKIYRGNTNSGGDGGGSNNPTFTVVHNGQNYTYEFESGMSFEQFVNSSYNDGSFSIGTANVLWNISNATVPNAVMFNSAALCTSVFDPAVLTLDIMVINSDEANVDNRMIVADKTYYCAATW